MVIPGDTLVPTAPLRPRQDVMDGLRHGEVVYLAGADNVSGPVTSCPHRVNQSVMNVQIEVQGPVTPSLPAFGHISPPQRHDPLFTRPLRRPWLWPRRHAEE